MPKGSRLEKRRYGYSRRPIVAVTKLDGVAAEDLTAASLALARDGLLAPGAFEAACQALEAALTERPVLAAPTLAVDLLLLLAGQRLTTPRWQPVGALRDARRQYEDHVLARLVAERRWARLEEAVAGLEPARRPVAAGLAAALLSGRLAGDGAGLGLSPAVVRRVAQKGPAEFLERGRTACQEPAVAAPLTEGLVGLARAARGAKELLTDAELFVVENVRALQSLAARVALAQLAEVSQALLERLPKRLAGQLFEEGSAPTAIEEASAYPVGGFSSLTTQGTLENLVSSELVYLDGKGAPRPDLFDVRFVEGELLYFSRDEAVAVRRRRRLLVVLDASLARVRLVDRGERVQRLVWTLGAVAALLRGLAGWFDSHALSFELVVAGPEDALEDELQVLSLVLRELVVSGQLTLQRSPSAAAALEAFGRQWAARGRTVVVSSGGLDGLSSEVAVDVAAPAPTVREGQAAALTLEGARAEDRFGALVERWVAVLTQRQRRVRAALASTPSPAV